MTLLERRRMMLAAAEDKPSDTTAWANMSTGTVVVSGGVFTFKYTSSGRNIYRTVSLSNPISVKTGDVVTLRMVDTQTSTVRVKASYLSQTFFAASGVASITATGTGTINNFQFCTTNASGTAVVTRMQLIINDTVLIGNDY